MKAPRVRPSADSVVYDHRRRATNCEMQFVHELGMHGDVDARKTDSRRNPTVNRLALLRGYLAGMELRTDWGVIDKAMVRTAVEREIEREVTARPAYIPCDGHGLIGARQYARRSSLAKTEVRRGEDQDDDSAA